MDGQVHSSADGPDSSAVPVRVVIVERSPLIRDLARMACEGTSNIRVVAEAEDAEQGLQACRDLLPDVVVFDPFIGGGDGLAFLRRLREARIPVRCLAITHRSDAGWVFEGRRLDMAGVVHQTKLPRDLAAAIRSVAGGGHFFPGELDRGVLSHLGALIRRTRERSRLVATLSDRQLEVLRLLAEGLTTRQIASRLGIAERTAEAHASVLYKKLGVRSRMEAVGRAIALGLVELDKPTSS
jgi:DNA-binding NarL/FixJ family response regulator